MKALIKLLLGLAGLFVVVVIAVVITVATVDPNDHKDWLSEKALEKTGRSLTLGGNVAVSLYPWLGLEANDVSIGNAKGFAEKDFLYAEHINLRVKLMPILKDQYEIDTVVVRGAKINLAKNKDGVTNWADLVSDKKTDDRTFSLAAVVLGGVDIQSASITWDDQSTQTRYDISNMNVNTDPLRYGEPLSLSVDMDVLANKPALEGHINLASTIAYDIDNQRYNIKPLTVVADMKGANVPGGQTQATLSAAIDLDLDKDTATISDLKLDALETQLLANLSASNIQDPGPSVEAKLDINGRNLALLFKVAEIEPLASHLATLKDQNFTLASKLSADMKRGDIDVSQLSIAMLGATVDGEVKARNTLSETPEYAGVLKAAGPDLPTLLQVLGQFQGGKDSTLSQYANTIANSKYKKFKVDASFSADMKKGSAEVPRLALELLGAKVNGEVSARNMQTKTPGYKGKLNASGPDLPTLLQVLGQAQGGKESALRDYGSKLSKLSKKAFKINADFDADLESGNINVPKLDIDSLGIIIAGNLKGKNFQADNGSVNGKLSIKGANLKPLLKALDNKALMDVVKSIDIEAGISGNASNMNLKPLTVKTTVTSEQTGKQAVEVFLNADTNINLDKQILSMAGLTLKGLGMNLQGSLEAKNFLEQAPAVKGQIKIAPFNLRSLMKKLGKDLPKTADKKVLTKVGLKTTFSASQTDIDITKLALRLDQSNVNGKLSVKNFEKPAIRFGIKINQINLDRYLAPPAKNKKGKPITPETAAGAVVQLPVETLQGLNIKGNLTIGKFTVSKARMTNVKLNIDGKDGKIKLAPATANLYQGTYKGDISINAKGKLPKLIINSSIKGVQIEPLLKDITGEPASLVGKSDISIAVVARGKNTDTFKQTLNGQAELKVTNGIVRGVDIPGALEQVEIMIEQKRPGKINTEGDTPFSSLTATLPINAGIVNNKDLLLTAPGLQVTGQGILARLSDMSWNYKLKAGVSERSVSKGEETYNVGGYKIDINCSGKLDPNNCKPDAFKLAGEAVQKMLLDKLLKGQGDTGTAPAGSNATSTNKDPGKELLDKALKNIFN